METLLELQRILDEQYRKLEQSHGSLTSTILNPSATRYDGINSPATAEMRSLTMCALGTMSALSLRADEDATQRSSPPERPPNPDPTKRSPMCSQLSPQGVAIGLQGWRGAGGEEQPRSVRMGNSPPKEVRKPQLQQQPVPPLTLPNTRPRHHDSSVESPLSTPRSGSAFLAHVNSGPPSTTSLSGSAQSTPRTPRTRVHPLGAHSGFHTGITVSVGVNGQPDLAMRGM